MCIYRPIMLSDNYWLPLCASAFIVLMQLTQLTIPTWQKQQEMTEDSCQIIRDNEDGRFC